MAYIKSKEELEVIKKGGKILGKILEKLANEVKPGSDLYELDEKAEALIVEEGGKPAFKGYQPSAGQDPFPYSICASVNDEVVHGFAKEGKTVQEGDVLTIDVGMEWPIESSKQDVINPNLESGGFTTDTAITVVVGEDANPEVEDLLKTTQESLYEGIRAMKIGNTVADVGKAIEDSVSEYGIVRSLCGHGVGHGVHEEPNVMNYYSRSLDSYELKEGVVLAIEPMLTMSGDYRVKTADDGWTILTEDGSLSAHFEHTVIVTKDGPVIATQRPAENVDL